MEAIKPLQATPSWKRSSTVQAVRWGSKASLRKLLCLQFIKEGIAREGIARNVSFILILGALLASAGVIFVMAHNEQHRDAKRILAYGTTLTEILAQAVAQPVAEGRVADLPALLRAIQDRSLAYGMVVDTDNRIIAHTDGRQRGRQFESPAASTAPAVLGLTTIASEDPVRGQINQ